MPFTLSHIGFVVPLHRIVSPRVFCALSIGSLLPDFGYFIRNYDLATFGHTFLGAIILSATLGLFLQSLVTSSFRRFGSGLPKPHSQFVLRWEVDQRWKPIEFIALAMGALAHNFVDSFTHETGLAVSLFPLLKTRALIFLGEEFHFYRLLQYMGSLFGLLFLASYYGFHLKVFCAQAGEKIWQDWSSWLQLCLVFVATILLSVMINLNHFLQLGDFYSLRVLAFQFLTTLLPLAFLALFSWAFFRGKCRRCEISESNQAA